MMSKDPNKYPKGWSRNRVEKVIAYYDTQSEHDAVAEADAAFEDSRTHSCECQRKLRKMLNN